MYAVIDAGGKQARVQVGEQLDVELLSAGPGDEVSFVPKLVVDGDHIVTERVPLEASSVKGRVIGLAKGPKIVGFTYKAKARGRRRYGHRQWYTTVEITAIDFPGAARDSAVTKVTVDPEDEPTAVVED
ncbi:MAG: 50S ribosomal protein L21 [Acidimicrobiales bacterium]|jgi:large subunit ribosomal protein L21